MKSLVERSLFAARPTFAGVLREIQYAVAELSGVSLAWANPNHMYSLQVCLATSFCCAAITALLLYSFVFHVSQS